MMGILFQLTIKKKRMVCSKQVLELYTSQHTAGKMFALHITDPGLNVITSYVPEPKRGMIPELRTSSKFKLCWMWPKKTEVVVYIHNEILLA